MLGTARTDQGATYGPEFLGASHRLGRKTGRWLVLSGLLMLALPIIVGTTPASAQSYQAMTCDQLWYARNVIFADNGYCFKTQRAINVFGPRCYPPYGELSSYEQGQVDSIRSVERQKGCSRGGGGSGLAPGGSGGSPYAHLSCNQLWYARNEIYAIKGYCFKTKRAQQAFPGSCFPPYGQLNAAEQREVNAIKTWEGRKGCR
jgi:hypothetical protein